MLWVFVEAGVALALVIFILWFTLGAKRKEPPAARSDDAPGEHPDRDTKRRKSRPHRK
jgi:hypothetical protein